MAVDVSNLTGGPAEFLVDNVRHSHTQGGITATITPANRMRTVDQYGESPVDVIHTGDDVRITAPMAEWNASVLALIYNPGADSTSSGSTNSTLGIGRQGGFVYTKSNVKITPLLTADNAKKSEFFQATPVGEFTLNHNNDDDRVFEVEWVALVDPSQGDGRLIGQLQVD